jgi:hypothetical protein
VIYCIPVYNKSAIVKILNRVMELATEKEYVGTVSMDQIKIVSALQDKLFDKARWLWTDLRMGGTISRENVGGLLISEDELETLASCLALWEWLFPAELAHHEFNQIRFLLKDLGKRTIR